MHGEDAAVQYEAVLMLEVEGTQQQYLPSAFRHVIG